MIHIQAPHSYAEHMKENRPVVFFSGSIEMGKAELWQDDFVAELKNDDVLILNPRRDDWDSSWDQSIECDYFREQVEWELQALEDTDIMLLYLQPGTKSPISLLEFGLYARSAPEHLVVLCPEGFWRKGNVDITCAKYGVKMVETKEELIAYAKGEIQSRLSNAA